MLRLAAFSRVHRGEGSQLPFCLLSPALSCELVTSAQKRGILVGRKRNVKGKKNTSRNVYDLAGMSTLLCCSMHFVEAEVNRTTGNCSRGERLARWEKTLKGHVSHAMSSTQGESVRTAPESPSNLKLESLQPELRKQTPQMGLGLSFMQTGRAMWQQSYMSDCWAVPMVLNSNPKLFKGSWLQQTLFPYRCIQCIDTWAWKDILYLLLHRAKRHSP